MKQILSDFYPAYFGTIVEAMSGFADRTGFPDREPVLPPMYLADGVAGSYGASAALLALREAERRHEAFINQFIALCEQQFSHPGASARLHPGMSPRLAARALPLARGKSRHRNRHLAPSSPAAPDSPIRQIPHPARRNPCILMGR